MSRYLDDGIAEGDEAAAKNIATNAKPSLFRLPQIMRLLRVRLERQLHFVARARGFVSGENSLQHRAAILTGHQWLFVILDAIHKMRHLLREAVVPFFLIDRK